ncbi:MAG: hypothetical protein F6K00_13475 [Leptolyngbya sp. SIOISBB]|nr:hypothetical protein [Leptolyngbya sp. SIOISBB]
MARADFNMVPFNHLFTPDFSLVTKNFPIEGNQAPIDDAYVLIQAQGVDRIQAIIINGETIGGSGLAPAPGGSEAWRIGFSHIRPGLLRSGNNSIGIQRAAGVDNFRVSWAIVHWREPG